MRAIDKCGAGEKRALQQVQRGTDTRIPVALVKQPTGEPLDPATLESLAVKVENEGGALSAEPPYTLEGGQLIVEVTKEISERLGVGVYTLKATGRLADPSYEDGYHDYTIIVELCRVVRDAVLYTPTAVTANVLAGLKGKDGLNNYQLAVKHGYQGTEEQFAKDIIPKSNYERAKELQGFQGTEVDYLVSLHGAPGESIYDIAVRKGFVGSEQAYLDSQKGKDGKDAYQVYLETTTDSTPMTEKQWANANDFFYQFLFLILKGAGAKPTETDMTADQVYELDRQRREIISAIKSKGVPANESNGIGDLARLINEIHSPVIDIFKEQQLLDWVSDELPTLRVYRGYAPASLRYMLGRCSRLKKMPTLIEVDEVVDISYMCFSCTSMTSAQLPIMAKVTTASSAFNGCASLESLEIGGLPLCKHMNSLVSGCKALKSLSLGDCSNVESIEQMATGCVSLANVTAVFGESLKSASMAFYGCSSLRKIDATIDLSTCDNVGNAFNGCTAIEEVRIKGLKVSLDLSSCANLSLESVRHLVENAQTVTSQSINLSRKLLEAHEEELSELGDTASDKGWTFNYR